MAKMENRKNNSKFNTLYLENKQFAELFSHEYES